MRDERDSRACRRYRRPPGRASAPAHPRWDVDDTHDASARKHLEAFLTIGGALVEPAVLASADGAVLAVNAPAAERLPALTPGVDLRERVADPPAWERFVDDVRSSDGTVMARLVFGPPFDVVSLVAGAAMAADGEERATLLLRVLRMSPRGSPDDALDPGAELDHVLAGTERLVAEHDRLEAI